MMLHASDIDTAHADLTAFLNAHTPLAIAVSGGVDSMTLACIAHRVLTTPPLMIHAVSVSVPMAATERVRIQAENDGWLLRELSADEFKDPNYLANPYNRCYFCKSNLYRRMAENTDYRLASGTNLDDLADYRPGLQAADEHQVLHPFVEARIDKAMLRELARLYGLHHFSELPAQPCLSSRIETGIPIKKDDLIFINSLEEEVRGEIGELATIRVRLRHTGVSIELGEMPDTTTGLSLETIARQRCNEAGYDFTALSLYHQGSAFINIKVI